MAWWTGLGGVLDVAGGRGQALVYGAREDLQVVVCVALDGLDEAVVCVGVDGCALVLWVCSAARSSKLNA